MAGIRVCLRGAQGEVTREYATGVSGTVAAAGTSGLTYLTISDGTNVLAGFNFQDVVFWEVK